MSVSYTQEFIVQLTTINCGNCGGVYAINEVYRQKQERDAGSWNCPYCKIGWGYKETEVSRLKKQITERDRRIANKRRRRAENGAKTRLKNRINAGTCPCCDQSFVDLAEHMTNVHPDFAATAEHEEGDLPTREER